MAYRPVLPKTGGLDYSLLTQPQSGLGGMARDQVAPGLKMYQQGMADREAQDLSFGKRAAGAALAAGNEEFAAGVAGASGDVDSALKIKQLGKDRLEQFTKLLPSLAKAADTPEKWRQMQDTFAPIFGKEAYSFPFEARGAFYDLAMEANATLERDAKQAEIDYKRAQTAKIKSETGIDDRKKGLEQKVARRAASNLIKKSQQMGKRATALLTHPGLEGATGPTDKWITENLPFTMGEKTANFVTESNTLVAKLALDVISELKSLSKTGSTGFGAMNEKELSLIMNAKANLDRAQSAEQYRQNLVGLITQINDSMANVAAGYYDEFEEKLEWTPLEVPDLNEMEGKKIRGRIRPKRKGI